MDKIFSQLLHKYNIAHIFTTRHGGISKAPYHTNNLALHVGDRPDDVLANREALRRAMGAKKLIAMEQIHSNRVEIINQHSHFLPPCDGLITQEKDIALMVMVADCTPVVLFDTKQKVIAALHVGRAGAFLNIIEVALTKMMQHFSSKSGDILAIAGVGIGSCCYEVGSDIANEAKALGYDFALTCTQESYHLDIASIIKHQLLTCKLKADNIELIRGCSSCETDRFFSYRKEGITGRMGAVISL